MAGGDGRRTVGCAHPPQQRDLGVKRRPVVVGVNRGPDRLDLVNQHRLGRLVRPVVVRQGQRRVIRQRLAERAVRTAAPAAVPEEEGIGLRLPLAHRRLARRDQLRVCFQPARLYPQPPAPAPCDVCHVERPETLERGDQRRAVSQQPQRDGKLPAIPVQRLGLATKGIEACVIEIGGGKARLPGRQPAPRAIVEAFAGDVHVVGIEHAVDEACHHIACCKIGHALDDVVHQPHRRLIAPGRVGGRGRAGELREAIVDEARHRNRILGRQQALEGADADMRMAEAHQHRRARRRRLVIAP